MKKFIHSRILDVIIIFILSLTPLLWFSGNSIMAGHDNIFPLDPIQFLQGRLFTWTNHGFGQSQVLIIGTIPIHIIDAIPTVLGFSLQQTQKIVYVFWFFMIGLSAYVFAMVLNRSSRLFALVASTMYQFNFFILQAWWVGERTKFSAYIAFPLILAVYFRVLRGNLRLLPGILYTSAILFVFNGGGLFGISLYGGFFVAIGVYVIYFSYLHIRQKDIHTVRRILLLIGGSLFGYVLTNAYYILPALSQITSQYRIGLGTGGGLSGFLGWASEISANASFINLFRLQGIPEWYDNPEHPFAKYYLTNIWLIAGSFLWPLLSFLTLQLYRKNREKLEIIIYLFLLYLVGIFFTAGTHPPLGFLYAVFINFVPGAIAFRSPYFKFAPAIFLSSSFLIAYCIDYFRGRSRFFLGALLLIFVLIYHFPYFTGNFFSWKKGYSTRLNIPEYVFAFGRWLNTEKSESGRVLMLPPNNPDLRYSMYDWGYLSFQSIPTLLSNESVLINNDRINSEERDLLLALYRAISRNEKDVADRLLSQLGIKYVVIQEDTVSEARSLIPVDWQTYKKVIKDDFRYPVVKELGKWIVYKIPHDIVPALFTAGALDVLSGVIKDVPKYYDFSATSNNFVLAEPSKEIELPLPQTQFYVPKCINCFEHDEPLIRIDERNILPDSFLYPFVLFKENLNLNKDDNKSLLYDYLGLSLKRISEMREMIIDNMPIHADVVNRYIELLRNITTLFDTLTSPEDKIKVASDIKYYVYNERVALTELFSIYANITESVKAVDRTTKSIASVLEYVDSYLDQSDPINNRIYQVSIASAAKYEIFVKTEDFSSSPGSSVKLALKVDEQSVNEKSTAQIQKFPKWISYGPIELNRGIHQLAVSFPAMPNVVSEIKENTTDININEQTRCFTMGIDEFDPRKFYRAKIDYKNDFSDNLLFYVMEVRGEQRRFMNLTKLETSTVPESLLRFIKTSDYADDVALGLCSNLLADNVFNNRIAITVNEIIYPSIILVPTEKSVGVTKQVSFKRISPTKYRISRGELVDKTPPYVVGFSQRFDTGWELSGYNSSHFTLNGYANGWYIDTPPSTDLILEYKPQVRFVQGVFISFISLVGGLVFLIRARKSHA